MNIVDFFRKVTGLEPTIDQINLLEALVDPEIKKIIVSAGRQTGKTLTCAVACLWWALEYGAPINILLSSAQDNWLYNHVRTIFNRNREDFQGKIVQEGTWSLVPLKGFETVDGSKCHVRGATEKNLRGIGADIVFLDEAAEMTNDTVTTALGNLSGPISKIVLLSTPHKTGIFSDIAGDPDKWGFKLFTWSEFNCNWHSQELLDTKKQMMTPQKWKTDVLGLPLEKSERAFFSRKDLELCVKDNVLSEGGLREAGLDFGFSSGFILLAITEKNGAVRRKVVLTKKYPHGTLIEEVRGEIQELCVLNKVVLVKADSRPVEYKRVVGTRLGDARVVYVNGNVYKEAMLGQLKRHVERHTIEIPQGEVALIKQLTVYRPGKCDSDDYVDALALSAFDLKDSGTTATVSVHRVKH